MKRALIITLAILNFLAFCLLAFVFYKNISSGGMPNFFIWGLPELIAALLALIGGILTIKRKNWRWGVTGLGIVCALVLYILILIYNYGKAL